MWRERERGRGRIGIENGGGWGRRERGGRRGMDREVGGERKGGGRSGMKRRGRRGLERGGGGRRGMELERGRGRKGMEREGEDARGMDRQREGTTGVGGRGGSAMSARDPEIAARSKHTNDFKNVNRICSRTGCASVSLL